MMHIIFEDYYKAKFKGRLQRETYFHFLEIVNFIVLNLPFFRKLTDWVSYSYQQHKEQALHLQKVYDGCKDMEDFCEVTIVYLKRTLEWTCRRIISEHEAIS